MNYRNWILANGEALAEAGRMRDTGELVRLLWDCWQKSQRADFAVKGQIAKLTEENSNWDKENREDFEAWYKQNVRGLLVAIDESAEWRIDDIVWNCWITAKVKYV